MFDVNVIGAIAVTQAFVALLGSDTSLKGPPGRIVNISSIGGKVGFPFMAGYAGSKFALEGISESLRQTRRSDELHPRTQTQTRLSRTSFLLAPV
jgi:NAD(P)-dependent dehydrogenase (short-subunit alcohol dehydrogenase family)